MEEYYKDGKVYITKEPFIDGPSEPGLITAHANDEDGNEYMLQWVTKDMFYDIPDKLDRVDWDNFTVRKL